MHYEKACDLVTFKTGKLDSNAAEEEGKYPFFTCAQTTYRINSYAFDTECVLLAGNNAGGIFPLKYYKGKFNAYQRTYVIQSKNPQVLNIKYLYFYLRPYLKAFEQEATGATTKFLTLKILNNLRVALPPVGVQEKIAAVLSAYDDLIESNRRRIELLEQMAEELYREWFVRFRFPGYEQAKFEKGLPVDWKRTGLGSLGTYLNGYAFKPSDLSLAGIPVIKIKEINGGVTAETPRNSGESIAKKYHFDDGAIIFSWSATLAVKIWDQGPGLLNQHLFKVASVNGIPSSFLYLSIKFCLPIFDSLTTGSTMKHIKRKELDAVKVGLPGKAILEEFDKSASPLLQEKLKLSKVNQLLVEARNQLLTRLISGKLPVDQLDIQFPPSMREADAARQEVAHA